MSFHEFALLSFPQICTTDTADKIEFTQALKKWGFSHIRQE